MLTMGGDGQASQTIKAAAPGQYRLSATIDDGQGHSIEGGYLFSILGQGFDGASFRFNDLEIIPDRKEYRPGETLRLLINTNQVNSTVLLFVRPTNNVYLPPKVVHLRGKSTVEEIAIVPRDMPNFFVEALTVAGGKVHSEGREIAVPPESRVVDVAVEPSSPTYKPGQKAKVKLKLTGPDGKPFAGSTVLLCMTRPSSTSPADRTCRTSRRSSGSGSETTTRKPSRASIAGSATSSSQTRPAWQELGIFGGGHHFTDMTLRTRGMMAAGMGGMGGGLGGDGRGFRGA